MSSRYPANGEWAHEPVGLVVGQRVKMDTERWWWTVRSVSEHYAVVARQERFRMKGTECYSVLDWRNGVRGGVNMVFGWPADVGESACSEMLAMFESGDLEVSQRNWAPIKNLRVEVLA